MTVSHGRRRISLGLFAGGLLAACSPLPSANDGGPDGGSTPGDPNVQVGAFTVRVPGAGATPATVTVAGKVYDAPTPALIIWELASESGGCKLLEPRVPFCSTSCGGSAVCVEDDTCQKYPVAKSVGTVTVSGVGGAEFSMSPVANTYQPPAGTTLSATAVTEGSTVRFTTAGGTYVPFTLEAKGIASLSLNAGSIPVAANQPVTLRWPAAQASADSRIAVKLDISHHGGTKGKIECTADDTGSLEIPAAMVTELLALGVAGFPTIIVTRQTIGSAVIAPGRVDLIIASEIEIAVTIAGLESCTSDAQCSGSKKCQADLTCQ